MARAGKTERESRLMGYGKRKINNGGKVSKSAAGRAERAPQEKSPLQNFSFSRQVMIVDCAYVKVYANANPF